MRGYAFVDTTNGNVDFVCSWGDDRDLPENYPKEPNQVIIVVDDIDKAPIDLGYNYCYNINSNEFKQKIKIELDKNPINHIDGVCNISIIYPDVTTIQDNIEITIDNQTVSFDITEPVTTIPFTSQSIGGHNILVESKTCWGKTYSAVEVI